MINWLLLHLTVFVKATMGNIAKLTPKQIKFAQELVYNEGRKTATQCAIDAQYSTDRAHVTASELQNPKNYPLVVQYIGKIRSDYQWGCIGKSSFVLSKCFFQDFKECELKYWEFI